MNEILLDALREENPQTTGRRIYSLAILIEIFVDLLTKSTNENSDEEEDGNFMSNSQSSDIECGAAFSSSISSRDNDSPRMSKRQNANSGNNNQGFEFIEREIGMCRPVCHVHCFENHFISSSRKMVFVKFMFSVKHQYKFKKIISRNHWKEMIFSMHLHIFPFQHFDFLFDKNLLFGIFTVEVILPHLNQVPSSRLIIPFSMNLIL